MYTIYKYNLNPILSINGKTKLLPKIRSTLRNVLKVTSNLDHI